jgi:hypothetical protein
MFSHPSVTDLLIWGFWEKAHWIPSAAYYRADWSLRPAGQAWRDLVFRDWWTKADAVTAADGTCQVRGFLGDYEIEVESGGVKRTAKTRIEKAGARVVVEW